MKRPSFQFYPGDWLHDTGLRACSLGARGLWIDMLSFMHQGVPYGHLTLPASKDSGKDILRPILPGVLARMVGCGPEETERLLGELEDSGVFSRTTDGVIFSRRMVEDEKVRQARANGGVESLNNPRVPRPKDTHKDTGKDILGSSPEGSFGGSPSSSSSSSNPNRDTPAARKPTQSPKGTGFNPAEIAIAICTDQGWSGKLIREAFAGAVEFQAKRMPEMTMERVGEQLLAAWLSYKKRLGNRGGDPLKFFQLTYADEIKNAKPAANILTDNPATRALAALGVAE